MTSRHFSDAHLDALALTVEFTRADLAANRRGWLTARQITHLQTDQRRQQWPGFAAWIALGVVIGALALLHLELAAEWLVVLVGMAILGGMSAYELRLSARNLHADPPGAAHVTLTITSEWQPRHRRQHLEIAVNGHTFRAPHALRDLLRTGQHYRIYYAPDACADAPCRILSMEPVNPGQSAQRESRPAA